MSNMTLCANPLRAVDLFIYAATNTAFAAHVGVGQFFLNIKWSVLGQYRAARIVLQPAALLLAGRGGGRLVGHHRRRAQS